MNKKNTLSLLPLALFLVVTINYHISAWLLPNYDLYDSKRIFELALLAIASIHILLSKSVRTEFIHQLLQLPQWVRASLVTFFILGLISSIQAEYPKSAALEVAHYLLLLVYSYYIAVQTRRNPEQTLHFIQTLLLLIAVLYIAMLIGATLTMLPNYHELITSSQFPGVGNRNEFAHFQLWTLFLISLPIAWLTKKYPLLKPICYSLIATWWFIAFINGARGMLLGIVVALVSMLFFYRARLKTWLLIQLMFMAIGVGLYLIAFHIDSTSGVEISKQLPLRAQGLADATNLSSTQERLQLWSSAIHMFLQHPLLGVGPMHFANQYNPIAAGPHNVFLQFLAEWGGPALLLFSLIIAYAYRSWFRQAAFFEAENRASLFFALTATLTTGLVYCCFGGVLTSPLSQVMAAVSVGLALGLKQKQPVIAKPGILTHSLLSMMLLSQLLLVGIGIFPEVLHIPSNIEYWMQYNNLEVLSPRFWVQGWLVPDIH